MTRVQVIAPIKAIVVQSAVELGFDLARVVRAEPLANDRRAVRERIRSGYMEGMPWFTEDRAWQASEPGALLPGARSIIVVALSYLSHQEEDPTDAGQPAGRVARYARWTDYHLVMKRKLRELAAILEYEAGVSVASRVFVDDGALLERGVARRAGLGWVGKNTNILTPTHGSWIFLGALITDLDLEADEPLTKTCGDCVRCLGACPTGAIVAPFVIDARRCISYLTIECRGPIPRELRPLVGDWVFGCDVCQEVCPVNEGVRGATMPELKRTGFSTLELLPLLSMPQEEFAERFRNSPIKRAKRVGLQRNACVALGNIGDERVVPALGRVLQEGEPLVRGHAVWALGRIGGREALRFLNEALASERDAYVRDEVEAALGDGISRQT